MLTPKRLVQAAAVATFLIVATGLVAVAETIGLTTAIKGSYALLAILFAAAIYVGPSSNATPRMFSAANTSKLVLLLALLACVAAQFISQRWAILVLVLPAGYYAVLARAQHPESPTPQTILQLIVLFSIPLLTELLQTGVYFGNLDLLKHGRYIADLLQSGSIYGISSRYQFYPGLHFLVGFVHSITGLSINTSLLLTGITTYSTVGVSLFYLLHRWGLGNRIALFATLAGTALIQPTYFALYFFPQSLAVILLLVALYAGAKAEDTTTKRYLWIGLPVLSTAVITHHLTFILFAPVVVLVPLVARWNETSTRRAAIGGVSLLSLGWLAALSYWTFVTERFITGFTAFTIGTFSTTLLGGTGSAGKMFRYGVAPPTETALGAVASLASADGLFYVAMGALVMTAVLVSIRRYSTGRTLPAFVVIGGAASIFILKTPFTIKSLTRLQLPFAFFFAGFLGIAIHHSLSRSNTSQRAVAALLIVGLCLSGPLVAAEGISTDERPQQYQFTDREFEQLAAICPFTARSETVATLSVTRHGLASQGCDVGARVRLSERGISHPAGLFVYQDRWPQHTLSVFTTPVYSQKVVMSDQWYTRSLLASNKVYGNGYIGAVWSGNRSMFNGRSKATAVGRSAQISGSGEEGSYEDS